VAKSVAIAGKGGIGKSTISALIVKTLIERGEKDILVIDADPDANLGTLLGVDIDGSIGDLREDALKDIKDFPAGMSKASYIEAGLHQIITEADGFDLITMGHVLNELYAGDAGKRAALVETVAELFSLTSQILLI